MNRAITDPTHPASASQALLANVRQSVRTAVEILAHLEQSLVRGRFEASVPIYEKLCQTLAGQRVWSLEAQDPDIECAFTELTEVARRLHAILKPYESMAARLSALASLKPAAAAAAPSLVVPARARHPAPASRSRHDAASDGELVLVTLRKQTQPMSPSRLRSSLRLTRKRLEAAIAALVAADRVTVSSQRGRRLLEAKGEPMP